MYISPSSNSESEENVLAFSFEYGFPQNDVIQSIEICNALLVSNSQEIKNKHKFLGCRSQHGNLDKIWRTF